MLQFSHDPAAGTLYAYFTELEEGQATYVLEYPASLLLDAQGRIFGLRLALDDDILLSQLDLAREGDFNWLDGETGHLFVRVADEQPAETLRLDDTAIFDLDDEERVLGIELALPAELRTPARLERLAGLMIELDAAPPAGEGPVVFGQAADDEEAQPADSEQAAHGEGEQPAGAEQAAEDQQIGAAGASEPPASGLALRFVELGPPAASPQPPASQRPPPTPGPPPAAPRPQAPLVKAGFVALVGKPNVGKSTLLNALLGERVAIVSPRPQTTRVPMRGILNQPGVQIVFVDTPGIHKPSHRLGQLMVDLAERTLPGADVIGFLVDISQPPSQLDRRIAQQVMRARGHKLLILNKVDLKPRQGASYLEEFRRMGNWELELAISARRGLGLSTLIEEITARLPEGPQLYPDEQLTDQSEQQLAAEFVREKTLYLTQQEVPHAVAVEVEEWEVKEHTTYIRMTINVERDGQKAIIIGAGGAVLKKIGSQARQDIERLLGRSVYLELWVKVRPNWRDDAAALGWLGYRSKDWQ